MSQESLTASEEVKKKDKEFRQMKKALLDQWEAIKSEILGGHDDLPWSFREFIQSCVEESE